MKTSELIFIGIKGSVLALNRATGAQVWKTRLKSYCFVNVAFLDGVILATTYGEIFCLDPLTGKTLWHNPLKGLGLDLVTIAAEGYPGLGDASVLAEKRRQDEAAASSASSAT